MPIGTPTGLGAGVLSGSAGLTLTFVTTININVGDLLIGIVAISAATPVRTVASISDGTNNYVKATSKADAGTTTNIEVWYVKNAAAVASGATMTLTLSAASPTSSAGLAAFSVSGMSPDALDSGSINTATATSTTPSVTSNTLAMASELVVGAVAENQGTGVLNFTEASGWTRLGANHTSPGANNLGYDMGYQIVSATTGLTYNPTGLPSNPWGAVVVGFRAATIAWAANFNNDLVSNWRGWGVVGY